MTNKNMLVWEHGKKTDPSATKSNNQGGRQSTSINGYWVIQKATELWGPIGSAWGYEILEDTLTEGVPIMSKPEKDVNPEMLCMSKMHTIKLRLWYPECSALGVTAFGHTPYIYATKNGPLCDMEAPKKSLTDALKKALSMLGFSADIFLGEWEDRSYVEQRLGEEAIAKSQDANAERLNQAKEYDDWLEKHLAFLSTAKSINELTSLFNLMVRKCNQIGKSKDKDVIKITREATAKRELLEEQENAAK